MTVDVAIRNGLVVDGTGAEPVRADVALAGGRVVQVGGEVPAAAKELDAGGRVVAPGFIDIHSHSDYTLLVDPRAVSAIHQGVTTEVVGNCGLVGGRRRHCCGWRAPKLMPEKPGKPDGWRDSGFSGRWH